MKRGFSFDKAETGDPAEAAGGPATPPGGEASP